MSLLLSPAPTKLGAASAAGRLAGMSADTTTPGQARGLAMALGFLTPLYVLPGVAPSVLQGIRGLLVVAVLLTLADRRNMVSAPHPAWLLLAAGHLLAGAANWDATAVWYAVLTVLGVGGGQVIVENHQVHRFLAGFRVAATLSGACALLDAAGITAISPVVHVQQGGYSGLSNRSTALAYHLAVALAVWFWQAHRHRRLWWLAQGAVLVAALVVCGGRGGLVAVLIATTAYPLLIGASRRAVASAVVVGVTAVAVVLSGHIPPTLSRLSMSNERPNGAQVDLDTYSSGRLSLDTAALRALPDALPFGLSANARAAPAGGEPAYNPHNALLAVTLAAGVPGAVAGTVLLSMVIRLCLRRPRRDQSTLLGRALLVVLLVESLLEGGGILSGGAGVLLFSMISSQLAIDIKKASAGAHETTADPANGPTKPAHAEYSSGGSKDMRPARQSSQLRSPGELARRS